MLKIATHNSCTGEEGSGLLSLLVTPFAKCQGKTLKEQYDGGCRYFDIRVRETRRGLVAAHGLWESQRRLRELMAELDGYAEEDFYVAVCYEGECVNRKEYVERSVFDGLKHCKVAYFAEKRPTWRVMEEYERVRVLGRYVVLDWRSWHTLIPIPWLWKKIYYDVPCFDDKDFRMVDFL